MPSPFPGMDPYLELPTDWGNFHHGLITSMQGALNAALAPHYFVRVEERVYITDEDDPGRVEIVPDARLLAGHSNGPRSWEPEDGGGLAIAEPIVRTTLLEPEVREAFLNVFDAQYRSVVTVIEVLSPSNKIRGSRGRESFVAKRREVMNSPAHWIEIDFLREGARALAPDVALPRCDYYVHVSRAQDPPKGRIWPILLTQRLPNVGVPLKADDGDVGLDLQNVFDETYDRSAYQVSTDYTAEPVPPLTAEQAAWADALLRKKGLRSGPGD